MEINKLKNVYHIRMEENLNFILPVLVRNNQDTVIQKGEMAVFIHLYYKDTIDRYFEYIKEIPDAIDIYISISESETRKIVEEKMVSHGIVRCRIIEKENRGRDISALLVAYGKMVQDYEYICFLHDKKAKGKYDLAFKDDWILSMWENMIATENYIYNIKDVLDGHPKLGVLAVPEPFAQRVNTAFENSWGKNFPIAVKIAEQLGLHCELDREIPPITLGTIFWCRTSALKKLWDYPWKYEDFSGEPMPDDGTFNHAIERIFAYVAQDAGYWTGVVRTVPCAEKQVAFMQDALRVSFLRMETLGIGNINAAMNYEKKKSEYKKFFQKFNDVYLYGAGIYGRRSLRFLEDAGLKPKGFVVSHSHKDMNCLELDGYPVRDLEEIEVDGKVGIIVAVGIAHIDEIIQVLEKKGIQNYIWVMGEEEYA